MLKALRGTKDILPDEVGLWIHIENSARDIFSIYGYNEIRTPLIEEAELFKRSIGEYSDIVQKEMYLFEDRAGRLVALRPEGTAPIVRAYLENCGRYSQRLQKFFYIGPMFRGERPQKGRQRQFHQIGVELIGSSLPFRDAEIIQLATVFLKRLGIKEEDFSVRLNSLGCEKDKLLLIKKCQEDIRPVLKSLCETCISRYDKNVLRIFDCKMEGCIDAIKDIKIKNTLCDECKGHFDAVKRYLNEWGVKFQLDEKIVRGLDYYTRTVFEITHKALGSQDAICAGGRYDNLIKDMGGKDTPAIGFALGVERLILSMKIDSTKRPYKKLDVSIVTTGKALQDEAFRFLNFLRDKSRFSCDVHFEEDSLKAQMRQAERSGARLVVIFGEEEFKNKKLIIKNMDTGFQEEVDYNYEALLKKLERDIPR